MENNDKDYESHVRSNESIRDNMDGVMNESVKSMSSEESTKCKNCANCTCNNDTNSMEFSRG